MRRFFFSTVMILVGLSFLGGTKKQPAVTVRFYGEVPAENSTTFGTSIELLDGSRSIWVSKIATVSEKDIKSFMPFQNPDGSVGAYFFLDEHGRLLLETLSIEQRGKMVAAIVNGRRVVDLLIDKRISDGIATIPTGLTPEEIVLLKQKFKIHVAGKPAN